MLSTPGHLLHAQIGQILTPLYTSLTMLLPDPPPSISVCLMQLQCTILHVPYAPQSIHICHPFQGNDMGWADVHL